MVRVQIFLFFSKCLSGPGRQVQSLGQSRNPPLSGCQGEDASPVCGDVSAAESSATGEGERLSLLKGFQEFFLFFFPVKHLSLI